MSKIISRACYRFIRFWVWLFYPRTKIVGAENLPEGPFIAVGNHAQMNGPIACELYFPGLHYTWCVSQMMRLREVPGYAYTDFWSGKPRAVRWFFRLLSYVIAPLSVCVFTNANTIPVYQDARVLSTFRDTLRRLEEGAGVVIFPERNAPHNEILCEFQNRFVDVARLYYKRAKTALPFVPIYVAPALRQIVIGSPVFFDPEAPLAEERGRVCAELAAAVTDMARSLPRHRVKPYRNIPKKDYPWNRPEGGDAP